MDAEHLAHLHGQAAYHRVTEVGPSVAAVLLAFREGADYDSPNYRWFAKRYDSFLYIDRVVVSASHRRRGWEPRCTRTSLRSPRSTISLA
jgi:predicted GNAT superfamily acetyltransferase